MSDTIFAPASGAGRAGIAVIRVSGPKSGAVLQSLAKTRPPPRVATRSVLTDPVHGDPLDDALILWFPAPHSYTGEDVAELHIHGGRAVMNGVMAALAAMPGVRMAGPGEFTRRAFENGRMDLTEAEAVADLIAAETSAQRRAALRQMEGELGRLYEGWAERLKRTLAHAEAAIDFADEDLPEGTASATARDMQGLAAAIAAHLDDNRRGERLREGFYIAILGPPNAGKSSLLNALAGREAAIVSPTPGTTRDVIEVSLDLGGYPVTLSDTAGLRDSADAIEQEGVRRAVQRADHADLRLIVFDGATWPQRDAATEALIDGDSLIVVNKKDVIPATLAPPPNGLFVSAATGDGLPALTDALIRILNLRFAPAATPALTRARHRAALQDALEHLRRAKTAPAPELIAEDARLALRALGSITGRVGVEDLLDVIFRDFCIGK